MTLPQVRNQQNNDEQTQTENEGSSEQRRAIARAESYTRLMACSRVRSIRQLEFEIFPLNDAQWIVDQLTSDWNEQTSQKATSYHFLMSLPPDSIRRLSAFEDLSAEQVDCAMTTMDNYKLTKKEQRDALMLPLILLLFFIPKKSLDLMRPFVQIGEVY